MYLFISRLQWITQKRGYVFLLRIQICLHLTKGNETVELSIILSLHYTIDEVSRPHAITHTFVILFMGKK
jgi:hypothetical protein